MGDLETSVSKAKMVVYIWLNKEEPFYVGKGLPGRELQKRRNKACSSKRLVSESKGDFSIEVIATGLTSLEACSLEKELISTIGTGKSGGPLLNFTEGGDGGDTWTLLPEDVKRERLARRKKILHTFRDKLVEAGKKGGKIAAEINKAKSQGPWDEDWAIRGREAAKSWRENNREKHVNFSKKGAKALWNIPGQKEINAKACSKTGKANRGSRWITNGTINKKLRPGQTMPESFYFGRV